MAMELGGVLITHPDPWLWRQIISLFFPASFLIILFILYKKKVNKKIIIPYIISGIIISILWFLFMKDFIEPVK